MFKQIILATLVSATLVGCSDGGNGDDTNGEMPKELVDMIHEINGEQGSIDGEQLPPTVTGEKGKSISGQHLGGTITGKAGTITGEAGIPGMLKAPKPAPLMPPVQHRSPATPKDINQTPIDHTPKIAQINPQGHPAAIPVPSFTKDNQSAPYPDKSIAPQAFVIDNANYTNGKPETVLQKGAARSPLKVLKTNNKATTAPTANQYTAYASAAVTDEKAQYAVNIYGDNAMSDLYTGLEISIEHTDAVLDTVHLVLKESRTNGITTGFDTTFLTDRADLLERLNGHITGNGRAIGTTAVEFNTLTLDDGTDAGQYEGMYDTANPYGAVRLKVEHSGTNGQTLEIRVFSLKDSYGSHIFEDGFGNRPATESDAVDYFRRETLINVPLGVHHARYGNGAIGGTGMVLNHDILQERVFKIFFMDDGSTKLNFAIPEMNYRNDNNKTAMEEQTIKP